MSELTVPLLKKAAGEYLKGISKSAIPDLYGVTDGKAVGTFIEHGFHEYLGKEHSYEPGSSASGIDIPELDVDLKVTSIKQPQSSSPFRNAEQKVYGLGYNLLVFVYEKTDDSDAQTAHLDFQHALFVDNEQTADYQTTRGLIGILERDGNKDDIVAFLEERNLPLDDISRGNLADRILKDPPAQGYLTVSNALQWRLQYSRAIRLAAVGKTKGVESVLA